LLLDLFHLALLTNRLMVLEADYCGRVLSGDRRGVSSPKQRPQPLQWESAEVV
jgi:hypothetical protein